MADAPVPPSSPEPTKPSQPAQGPVPPRPAKSKGVSRPPLRPWERGLTRSKDPKAPRAPLPPEVKWGYILGWGLCGVGLIVMAVAVASVVRTTVRGIQKLQAPGEMSVRLPADGLYFAVYPQLPGGPSAKDVGAMTFSLTREADGVRLPVRPLPPVPVFSVRGTSGMGLFQTEADEAGAYRFSAEGGPAGLGPVDVYLIHESLQTNRGDLVAGLIVCVVFLGFGAYVLIRTARRAGAPADPSGGKSAAKPASKPAPPKKS